MVEIAFPACPHDRAAARRPSSRLHRQSRRDPRQDTRGGSDTAGVYRMPTAEVRRRSQLIQRDLDAQRALALVQRQADLVLDAVTHVLSDVERLNRALEQVRRTQELMVGSALGASAPTRREVAA